MDSQLRHRKNVMEDTVTDQPPKVIYNNNSVNRSGWIFFLERFITTRVAILLATCISFAFLVTIGPMNRSAKERFLSASRLLRDRAPHTSASSDIIYNVAVLGAGPAGLTAALFAARSGLSVILFGSQSGLLSETPQLENFPGYASDVNTGIEWLQTTRQQAQEVGVKFALPGLLVTSMMQINDTFSLLSKLDTPYRSLSVIVATGATPRRLGLPKEEDLWGVSIHNCAICDGSLYDDKTVLIVGGGDAAVDAAVYLSRRAKHVVLVHRRKEFTATQSMKHVKEKDNIKILTPFKVSGWEMNAQKELSGAHLKRTDTGNGKEDNTLFLACDGVFLMIGATPNTKWIGDTLELDIEGFIQLRNNNTGFTRGTSLLGVFAAGEVTDHRYRQAITAAAEGAQAALDAERWLRQVQSTPRTKDSSITLSSERKKILGEAHTKMIPPLQRGIEFDSHTQHRESTSQYKYDDNCDFGKKGCIAEVVNRYPLVVFSSYTCPECHRLLELLTLMGVKEPHIVELGPHRDISQAVRNQLTINAGSRNVPSLFIGGESVGGYSKAKKLQYSGELNLKMINSGVVLVSKR